jgi:simple sugar transport system ATP-binding protein
VTDATGEAGADDPDDAAPAVRLDGVTKRFGDVVANDGVDLTLAPGTVHALVGENGAGKTTLMSVLYGLYRPDAGRIVVDGVERDFASPRDATDAGVGMIHQHFMLVDTMTVAQNVVLGHEPTNALGLVDMEAAKRRIRDLCDRYGFDVDDHLDARVESLGVGAQQRVEILKSLYRGAEVLVLDEPTAVLTPQEVERLYEVMRELTAQGKSLVFITHKLEEAMTAASEITVLRDGRAVGTVDADHTSRAELAQLMVGRDVLFDVDRRVGTPGVPVLDVESLRVADDRGLEQVSGVEFTVHEGEVFGIAGVEGNGQRELVEAITGLRPPESGRLRLRGDDVTAASRRERIDRGVAYIPEDRQERGLVMEYDLVENALLGNQRRPAFSNGRFLDWAATRDHAERIVEAYDVQPRDVDATAASLSGGNQQKFIVGREFEHGPDLVVAAHPTRGVDVGSIEFIHERLLELRDEGTAVLLVSSKLDEARQLSDRLGVMSGGDLVDVVDPAETGERELGLLMAGEHEDADRNADTDTDATAVADGGDDP